MQERFDCMGEEWIRASVAFHQCRRTVLWYDRYWWGRPAVFITCCSPPSWELRYRSSTSLLEVASSTDSHATWTKVRTKLLFS